MPSELLGQIDGYQKESVLAHRYSEKNWGRTANRVWRFDPLMLLAVRPLIIIKSVVVMEEPLLQWLFDEIRENQVDRYEYRYTPGWRVLDDRYGPHECHYHILQGLAQKSEW